MTKRKLSSTNFEAMTDNVPNSKRPKLNDSPRCRVSATKTRNYLMNDPLLDWLNMYGKDAGLKKKSEKHLKILFKEGHEFEDRIMHDIFKQFPGTYEVIKRGNFKQRIIRTKMAIAEKIPIIYQGVVENTDNNSFGIPDLIVRVDFLNTLMKKEIVSQDKLEADPVYADSYCIIDIKHSSIHLSPVDRTIHNSARIQPYKGQVIIYSEALAQMQDGYLPPYAYILGKRTVISKKSYEPFDYLGVVDLHGKDKPVIEASRLAVAWYQDLKARGKEWDIWVPHRWEMTPNMCNNHKGWEDVKYQLAYHQGEITLLWKAGFNERNQLWNNGIKSWRNRRFQPKMLKAAAQNTDHLYLTEQALEINRTNYRDYLPRKIKKSIQSFLHWRDTEDHLELYIDFETASNHIFMIGMGYTCNNTWKFEYFVAKSLDAEDEGKVVRQWLARLKLLRKRRKTRLLHWTSAERTNYNNALRRHNIRDISIEWVDLYKFFIEVPISVRGSFTYSLKNIARALHSTGHIDTIWQDDNMTGLTAMMLAKEAETERVARLIDVPMMKTVVDYNEIDCKVLWEILRFVRKVM